MFSSLTIKLSVIITLVAGLIHFAVHFGFSSLFNICASVIVFLLCCAFLINFFVTTPLHKLINAMRLLEQGNSSAKLEISGGSLMKELFTSFNLMVDRTLQLLDSTAQQVFEMAQSQERTQHVAELTALNRELEKTLAEVRLLSSQQESVYIGILNALVTTIEASDEYTHGHSTRVTNYSLALAARIGLPDDRAKVLRQAAILHDIGKIGIDKSILHKSGRLTDEEMAMMKQHPAIAMNILRHIDRLADVQEFVAKHHERYDGTGYPFGIGGEDLPVEARILAVADTFDAMTSHRPYRKGLPLEVAIAELGKYSGTQFDPVLARNFIDLIREGELTRTKGDFIFVDREIPIEFLKTLKGTKAEIKPIVALIVEDDPLSALMVRDYFERLGHRMDTAATAAEGFRLFCEGAYDLVFLDIGLPDQDGYLLARSMRRAERELSSLAGQRSVICALTGSTEEDAHGRALASGMNLFIHKPFNSDVFAEIIEMTAQIAARKSVATTE